MLDLDINSDETLEDLQYKNLRIVQKKIGFRFGMDPVLLCDFAHIKHKMKILDIGTGSGIIPILLSQRANNLSIDAFEIQDDLSNMALRSIKINHLEDIISIYNDDIRNFSSYIDKNSLDLIITNPPYYKSKSSILAKTNNKIISKHEKNLEFNEIANIAQILLKDNAKFVFCLPANRLAETISILHNNNLEPKRIRFVHSHVNKEPYIFLMEASKNGKSFVKILPPLICYKEGSIMTEELLKIYHVN